MGSRYLLKPLRTLREACRDIRATYPESITWDCAACANGEFCAISEEIKQACYEARHVDELGYVRKLNTQ